MRSFAAKTASAHHVYIELWGTAICTWGTFLADLLALSYIHDNMLFGFIKIDCGHKTKQFNDFKNISDHHEKDAKELQAYPCP